MPRTIDQIRANKLPANMMQFAAKGALSVPADENIEILVYLAKHNKVFGDLARMTLAGWDEKASLNAAANPNTSPEVLEYLVSPENIRPALLPPLLENPSVKESEIEKFAISATPESITVMLASPRVRNSSAVLKVLCSNPYLKENEGAEVKRLLAGGNVPLQPAVEEQNRPMPPLTSPKLAEQPISEPSREAAHEPDSASPQAAEAHEAPDEEVSAYLAEHAGEIAAEQDKKFQAVGGIVDLLGADYFPVSEVRDVAPPPATPPPSADSSAAAPARAPVPEKAAAAKRQASGEPRRENTLQKINNLDVKGRIQLALKGNKEERSILIRDGTKVVALAVLDAPKITDGEVEKFALQKNVLEAVLRTIPLKRRFMKNYAVVRNLTFNPRTPLDLSLGLVKHLLAQDLKNLSGNKEISETVRKLALKMYKQKMEAANKK